MKKVMLVLFAALYLWGCECEEVTPTLADNIDPFLITSSNNGTDGDFFLANFSINKIIDASTVLLATSVLVEGLDSAQVVVDVFKFNIQIFGDIQGCGPNTFPCNGTVRIIFKGDGSNPIRSSLGQKLDGDRDGSDGGDAAFSFTF